MISVIYLANQLAHQHAKAGGSPEVLPAIEPQILGIPGVGEGLPAWHDMAEAVAHEPQGAGHA